MSVIVSKSTICCTTTVTSSCIPAKHIKQFVDSGDTITLDSFAFSFFKAVKWHIVISNLSTSKVRCYEMFTTHQNGTSPSYNLYGILGDQINHTVNLYVSGSDINFDVTNNEGETLLIYATRIDIPISTSVLNTLPTVTLAHSHSLISAGQTMGLDLINVPVMRAVKWFISVYNSAGNKESFQVLALENSSTSGEFTAYSNIKVGNLDYTLTIAVDSGLGMQLQLQNNSVETYRADVTRLPIQLDTYDFDCQPANDIFLPTSVSILPTGSDILDIFETPLHSSTKWLIAASDPVSNKTRAFEICATYQPGGSANYVVYSYLGPYLNVSFDVMLSGTNLICTATNNESSAIVFNLIRLPVLI